MRNPWKYSMFVVIALLAFCSAVAVAQNVPPAGQNAPGPQAVPGRIPNTKDDPGGPAPVHDVTGTWLGPGEPALSNRVPQMTPAGLAKLKLNIPDPFSASSNDPWKTCDPFGMPRVSNNEIREIGFAQMPDRIIILENFGKVWREVWTDGRPLPKNVGHPGGLGPLWYGYSIGHWQGDNTLIVDTVGMDEKTWVDRRGYPHTVDAHAQETYTRPDHNHLNFVETITDPAFYTASFVLAKANYKWITGEDDPKAASIPFSDEQAFEQICIPSEVIEYNKLLADQADEDAITGNGNKKSK
jgi:hypothetical protein